MQSSSIPQEEVSSSERSLRCTFGHKIWGAGLDVTNPEPIFKDDPILELSNVCVFPHIGSATEEARNGMAKLAAENLIAFSKGNACLCKSGNLRLISWNYFCFNV
jgi:phosphoglycerate dehydrogenase-like enzyme